MFVPQCLPLLFISVHLGFLDCSVLIVLCNLKESSDHWQRQPCQTEHNVQRTRSSVRKRTQPRPKQETRGRHKIQWTLCVATTPAQKFESSRISLRGRPKNGQNVGWGKNSRLWAFSSAKKVLPTWRKNVQLLSMRSPFALVVPLVANTDAKSLHMFRPTRCLEHISVQRIFDDFEIGGVRCLANFHKLQCESTRPVSPGFTIKFVAENRCWRSPTVSGHFLLGLGPTDRRTVLTIVRAPDPSAASILSSVRLPLTCLNVSPSGWNVDGSWGPHMYLSSFFVEDTKSLCRCSNDSSVAASSFRHGTEE